MSDGSANIKFINPTNFTTISNLKITQNGNSVRYINELELVNDTLLYANILMKDLVIIANISTGEVVGEIDISSLRKLLHNNPEQEVANGIAYNKKENIFYLTGKN
jgi:glutamine cyclotransferase